MGHSGCVHSVTADTTRVISEHRYQVEDTVNTRITTRMRWAGLLATTALVASGCASSADNDSKDKSDDGIDYTTRMMNVSEPKGEPVKGGTLRVAEYSEARGFNPTQTYPTGSTRSEEHTSELQSLMRISYAVFCLKKTKN